MISKGGFRSGNWCVNKIFTLKYIGENARQKKRKVYVGFMDLEKAYYRVNRGSSMGGAEIAWNGW